MILLILLTLGAFSWVVFNEMEKLERRIKYLEDKHKGQQE